MANHTVSTRTYYLVFTALMVCTYLTVQIAFIDLGPLNVVAALGIAAFKATLVVLFFMHVRYGPRLIWLIVAGSIFWLSILLLITFADYLTRAWGTYG